jgi:phytoene synthase
LAVELLLPRIARPHAHALYAFFTTSDDTADEGDLQSGRQAFAEWSAATMTELRCGDSEHPLRRALVHTAGTYGLDPMSFQRFLAATAEDNAGPVEFSAFEHLRGFMRGVSGTPAVLAVRLLAPDRSEADRLASLQGEVFQLVDILADFTVDLARDRLYLPLEDLDRFGVRRTELKCPEPSPALDALVRFQVRRARGIQREAAGLADVLPPPCRPFIAAAVDIHTAHLDLAERMGARLLRQRAALSRPHLFRLVLPHYLAAQRFALTTRRTVR